MKSIRTILLVPAALAGTFLISACSTWHTTGETVVGDPTIAHQSANLKSVPVRGSAAADQAKPTAAAPAKPAKGKAAASSTGSGTVAH